MTTRERCQWCGRWELVCMVEPCDERADILFWSMVLRISVIVAIAILVYVFS